MTLKNTRRGQTHSCFPKGFTLIELLVVVVIIGILGAIMLPQYQRAVLKSRYAALMPIAKAMADSNEAYYLEYGEYADNAEDLPVQGRRNYSDGTQLEFGTTSDYSYVLATRDNDFPNKYIVYQKHSRQFPGEIHCEADVNNTQAQEVCKSFGPTQDIGETLTSGYLTYVLFGTGNGEAPSGDEPGNDEPVEPAEPSTPAVTKMTAEEAQALADLKCLYSSYGCVGIANDDGSVTVCENMLAYVDSITGKCLAHTTGAYVSIYDTDGNRIQSSYCDGAIDGHCYVGGHYTHTGYNYTIQQRICANQETLGMDGTCPGGLYAANNTSNNDSAVVEGRLVAYYLCSTINTSGACTGYRSMQEWNNNRSKTRTCTKINTETPTKCDTWSAWQ